MGKPAKLFGFGPSEKSPCWLRLRIQGSPGHASVPHGDNAVARLVRALARVEERAREPRMTPPVRAMLELLKRRGFLAEEVDLDDSETIALFTSADAHLHAVTHDTVSITGVKAGNKHNVIPVSAEATLDCRLLPDTDADEFVAHLEALMDDPGIEIERLLAHSSGASSMDTPAASAVAEAVGSRFGDEAAVMPVLSPGFTDSHAYRRTGAQAYGFIPALLTREELTTIHGHNERISQANLGLGIEILLDVVRRIAERH
jgi:acetylornithine deacetylase/succinyl-diaminopimelate desuccinylase-like protein